MKTLVSNADDDDEPSELLDLNIHRRSKNCDIQSRTLYVRERTQRVTLSQPYDRFVQFYDKTLPTKLTNRRCV